MREYFRQRLLDGNIKYTVLFHFYQKEIKQLGVTEFIKWLSIELDIPTEKIKRNNFYSATFRDKHKKQKTMVVANNPTPPKNHFSKNIDEGAKSKSVLVEK